MLSQDSRMHKAVGFVAHLGDANCFVKDVLSRVLCCVHCSAVNWHKDMPVRVHSNTPFIYLNLDYGIWQRWHVLLIALDTGNIFWFGVGLVFFLNICSFLCQFLFCHSKLSLAFQHPSGMLLFSLRFRLVTYVVKSQCHSVLSVLYCSLLHECFVGAWVQPSF